MLSYQYKDPHIKDKTVSRPSYLQPENPVPGKDGLYIETGPRLIVYSVMLLIHMTYRYSRYAFERGISAGKSKDRFDIWHTLYKITKIADSHMVNATDCRSFCYAIVLEHSMNGIQRRMNGYIFRKYSSRCPLQFHRRKSNKDCFDVNSTCSKWIRVARRVLILNTVFWKWPLVRWSYPIVMNPWNNAHGNYLTGSHRHVFIRGLSLEWL